jgi:hypothetical protein
MKYLVILISALFLVFASKAQTKISGTIRDMKSHIVAGASIQIKGSYDGSVSDSTSRFSFKSFEKGTQTIVVSNIGFKSVEQVIELKGEPIEINFALKEEISELKAVVVTAGSFEAGDKKRAATVLNTLDVLTTGGANADITSVLKTLPGAQQVGDQEGLFVRGGAGYEAKQFIDGTLVNNPYYSSVPDIAQRGRFSPNLFKGTVFSTGGYSALYGQALSSAVILESIDLPDQSQVNASISTVFLGVGLQELAKNKKSSWGFNYGYTNVWPYFQIVKQGVDYFRIPEFHTADANFRIKTKSGGIIKYYSTFSHNQLGLRRPDIDSLILKDAFSLTNYNWYNNLSWRENLGNGWKMNLGLGYSTDHNDIHQNIQNQQNQNINTGISYIDTKTFTLENKNDLSQIKLVFDKRISGISVIRFGSEYMYAYNKSNYNGLNTILKDNFMASFAEADLYITNSLALKTGARLEQSSLLNKMNIAPRLSLAYKLGNGAQMSMAYGVFYQKPESSQLLYTSNLGYTKATHYIVNYMKVTTLQTFRVEAFYKKYTDLVKTFPDYNNTGTGDAKGIELFWRDKKTIKGMDYWISYSYLDTKRDYLNYPHQLQPNFAANHTASFVLKKFYSKLNTGFNFTYTYATGRPYYDIRYNANSLKYAIADQGKTIDYHNLGFSMNWLTNVFKSYAVVVASVTNVLGSDQVFGYNYSYNGHYKEAITPVAPRFFFLGVFLSWGVDRRQDAINNNL